MASLIAIPFFQEEAMKFNIPMEHLTLFEGFVRVELHLRPVTEDFQLTLSDFSEINANLSQANNSLTQCLNILIGQHTLFAE